MQVSAMQYNKIIGKKILTRRSLIRKIAHQNSLISKHKQMNEEIYELLTYVRNDLGPELKKYHNSRVNTSKCGGGGGKATINFVKVTKKVKDIIDDCGYKMVDSNVDRVNRLEYIKNAKTYQDMTIHFRLRTNLGIIVNVIIQTQSLSGGAHNKAKYHINTMNEKDEKFIFMFNTNIDSVKSKLKGYLNTAGNPNNITCFTKISKFEKYLKLL